MQTGDDISSGEFLEPLYDVKSDQKEILDKFDLAFVNRYAETCIDKKLYKPLGYTNNHKFIENLELPTVAYDADGNKIERKIYDFGVSFNGRDYFNDNQNVLVCIDIDTPKELPNEVMNQVRKFENWCIDKNLFVKRSKSGIDNDIPRFHLWFFVDKDELDFMQKRYKSDDIETEKWKEGGYGWKAYIDINAIMRHNLPLKRDDNINPFFENRDDIFIKCDVFSHAVAWRFVSTPYFDDLIDWLSSRLISNNNGGVGESEFSEGEAVRKIVESLTRERKRFETGINDGIVERMKTLVYEEWGDKKNYAEFRPFDLNDKYWQQLVGYLGRIGFQPNKGELFSDNDIELVKDTWWLQNERTDLFNEDQKMFYEIIKTGYKDYVKRMKNSGEPLLSEIEYKRKSVIFRFTELVDLIHYNVITERLKISEYGNFDKDVGSLIAQEKFDKIRFEPVYSVVDVSKKTYKEDAEYQLYWSDAFKFDPKIRLGYAKNKMQIPSFMKMQWQNVFKTVNGVLSVIETVGPYCRNVPVDKNVILSLIADKSLYRRRDLTVDNIKLDQGFDLDCVGVPDRDIAKALSITKVLDPNFERFYRLGFDNCLIENVDGKIRYLSGDMFENGVKRSKIFCDGILQRDFNKVDINSEEDINRVLNKSKLNAVKMFFDSCDKPTEMLKRFSLMFVKTLLLKPSELNAFWFVKGVTGSGKTTLMNFVHSLLDEIIRTSSVNLTDDAFTFQPMLGNQFVSVKEFGDILTGRQIENLKRISGGENVSVNRKYEKEIEIPAEFMPTLAIISNHDVKDVESALLNRLYVINFTKEHRNTDHCDTQLPQKLELEKDEFLDLMLQIGIYLWNNEKIYEFTAAVIRNKNNQVMYNDEDFLDDYFEGRKITPEWELKDELSELRESFKKECRITGFNEMMAQVFIGRLSERYVVLGDLNDARKQFYLDNEWNDPERGLNIRNINKIMGERYKTMQYVINWRQDEIKKQKNISIVCS